MVGAQAQETGRLPTAPWRTHQCATSQMEDKAMLYLKRGDKVHETQSEGREGESSMRAARRGLAVLGFRPDSDL